MSRKKPRQSRGLRAREGNWHYRFKINGYEYSGNTGLAAIGPHVNDALAIRAEERQRILSGNLIQQEVKPFNKAADEFMEWCKGEYRTHPDSARRIQGSMASLRRFFQNEPLGNIGPGKIEKYKTSRRAEFVKEITLRHDLHNLSLLFQYGNKQGWCLENPMRSKKTGGLVDIPSDKDAVRMYILTEEEETQYFAAAAMTSKDLCDVGRLMILQGCRPEEVMSLEQRNVDLRSRTFHITRGKSNAAKRELEMYAESAEIFARRLQDRGRWVFPSSRKPGHHIAKLVNAHNHVREETGLEFVMYDFRHTIATRWVEAGVDLPTVAAWLGHSSLACIMKYVHIQPKHRQEAKEQYEKRLAWAKGDGPSAWRPQTPVETDDQRWKAAESFREKVG